MPEYIAVQTEKRTQLLSRIKQRKFNSTRHLYVVTILCSLFMSLEFIGGLISNSLAIISDAAHVFADLTALLISVVSISISYRPPT